MRCSMLLAALALMSCNGAGPQGDWSSTDLRIDGSGAGDRFDSEAVQLCTSGAELFVAWHDAREGQEAIWLQHSSDGGQRWLSQPIRVNDAQASATRPALACSGETVFVAWEDTRDGELENKNIYFDRSFDGGETWLDDDLRLSDDRNGRAMSLTPRLALAGEVVVVTWSDARNGAFDVYLDRSTDEGATFEGNRRINSDPAGSAFAAFPQIAANDSGNVVLAWEDSRGGLNDIYSASSSDLGQTFSADVRLDAGVDPGTANSFRPRLALDDAEVYVVWQDERNAPNRDIFFNRSTNGGASWLGSARLVESDGLGVADSANPSVALQSGVAHIVWQDRRSGGFDVYYRSFVNGDPRAIAVEREGRIPDDAEVRLDLSDRAGTANSLEAVITVEGDRVVVLWEERRFDGSGDRDEAQGFNEVYYNASEDRGMTWLNEDLRLDSFCRGRKYSNAIQASLDGDAVVATWIDGRRGSADILFTRRTIGQEGESPPESACALAAEGRDG